MAAQPLEFDLNFLRPAQAIMPRILGGAVEGGSALNGITLASDASGGGLVALDYQQFTLNTTNRDAILFYNKLMVALQGGVRLCVVPFLTDILSPITDADLLNGDIITPFSDGTFFSDGTGFYQPQVSGTILNDADVGSAEVRLTVVGGRALQGGEWFGLNHPKKSFRAYCVTEVTGLVALPNGNFNAVVKIRPTLRETISANMPVDWWRPRCLMRLREDPQMLLQQFWRGQPSFSFIEAFT